MFAACAVFAIAASPALAQHDHEHGGQGQSATTEDGQAEQTQQEESGTTAPDQDQGSGMMMRQGQGGMMGPGGEGMMMGPGGQGQGMMRHGMMRGGMMGPDSPDTAEVCLNMGDMMGPSRHGMGRGTRHGMQMRSVPLMEGRLAYIKADLEITGAQTSAWDAYANAVRARHTAMQSVRDDMMKAKESGSALARLDSRIKATETKLESLKALKPAVEGLYAVLSDAQKEKADKLLSSGCPMR
jgi:hypothetical protein